MRYRTLGTAGIQVSEIGFGAWGIGGGSASAAAYGKTDDQISRAALDKAFDLGINFFDTSNLYGLGHSENLLGEVFAGRRQAVFLATKAGYAGDSDQQDFSAAVVGQSLAASLKRLRTDYVDLLQLHDPQADELARRPDTVALLHRLKADGRARAIGVSVKNPADAEALLQVFPFATVQANFNMLDVRALTSGLLQRLHAAGVGFIARTPLAFGFLSGNLTGDELFAAEDHRSRWPRAQLRLWADGARDLKNCCQEAAQTSPVRLALRFCLSFAEVATVIPGMLTAAEVGDNAAASAEGALCQDSCRQVLKLHETRKFFLPRGE